MASNSIQVDQRYLKMALEQARAALQHDDVPVGAVVVDAGGRVVGEGRNRREQLGDPTAHAEMEALRAATARSGSWRLDGTTLYVTLEPCPMCAGAALNARVSRVVFGCYDDKAGALASLFVIGRDPRLNHRFSVTGGVLADECAELLTSFFKSRRNGSRHQ